MQLDILSRLNAERAARRAVLVVTETDNGRQRLVKGEDAARDPLKDVLLKHLRSGKSGMEETPDGKVFLTVHVPPPRLVITYRTRPPANTMIRKADIWPRPERARLRTASTMHRA